MPHKETAQKAKRIRFSRSNNKVKVAQEVAEDEDCYFYDYSDYSTESDSDCDFNLKYDFEEDSFRTPHHLEMLRLRATRWWREQATRCQRWCEHKDIREERGRQALQEKHMLLRRACKHLPCEVVDIIVDHYNSQCQVDHHKLKLYFTDADFPPSDALDPRVYHFWQTPKEYNSFVEDTENYPLELWQAKAKAAEFDLCLVILDDYATLGRTFY